MSLLKHKASIAEQTQVTDAQLVTSLVTMPGDARVKLLTLKHKRGR